MMPKRQVALRMTWKTMEVDSEPTNAFKDRCVFDAPRGDPGAHLK